MKSNDPRVDSYVAKAAPFARPILGRLRELAHQHSRRRRRRSIGARRRSRAGQGRRTVGASMAGRALIRMAVCAIA